MNQTATLATGISVILGASALADATEAPKTETAAKADKPEPKESCWKMAKAELKKVL